MRSNLNEIRVGSKDLILKDNIVNSPILPQKTAELERSVIIEGNVEINGAVYGDRVVVHNGPCEFKKAVYGKEEVVIDPLAEGSVLFHNAVASSSVVSASSNNNNVTFSSDINAERVILRSCFVGGSVYADEIILDHAVVIGSVFATKSISINNSIIGTFNSQSVTLEGLNYLLFPSAFSVEPINATSNAELYNITLADLMDLFKGDDVKEMTGKIRMDISKDQQRSSLKADDGTILLVHSYSVAGKVLVADLKNFEKLENHFLINAASLSSQLMKKYEVKNSKGEDIKLDIANIRAFFFSVLDGDVEIKEIDGKIDFEELKKKI